MKRKEDLEELEKRRIDAFDIFEGEGRITEED